MTRTHLDAHALFALITAPTLPADISEQLDAIVLDDRRRTAPPGRHLFRLAG